MRATGAAACLLARRGGLRHAWTGAPGGDPGRDRSIATTPAPTRRGQRSSPASREHFGAGMDSIYLLVSQLNDGIQRVSREDAANFDNLQQRLYQVANVASNTQSNVRRLGAQIETAVSSAPAPADTTHGAAGLIPQPDVLLTQASQQMERSAYSSARHSADHAAADLSVVAAGARGGVHDGTVVRSDRDRTRRAVYYTRVWKTYPDSPLAPTALYKLGMLELKAQNVPAARGYFQQIVDKYKTVARVRTGAGPSARKSLVPLAGTCRIPPARCRSSITSRSSASASCWRWSAIMVGLGIGWVDYPPLPPDPGHRRTRSQPYVPGGKLVVTTLVGAVHDQLQARRSCWGWCCHRRG